MNRAFVASALLPAHDRESGSRRLHHLIEMLLEEGWSVTFAARDCRDGQRYVNALRQRGVKVLPDLGHCDESFFAESAFDLALISFWYVAEQLQPIIRAGRPSTPLLIDTVDVHFLRNARQRSLQGGAHPFDHSFADEMVRELNTYAASDGVLVVSEKEAELLADLLGTSVPVRAVPDYEEMVASAVPIEDRSGVLFVGNFGHTPNIDAADLLCRKIVPLLDADLLAAHPVRIVGNGRLPAAEEYAAMPGVEYIGWVPDLLPYLHRSRVAVAPLQWGAGTKRKVIQYLMAGVPTVATGIAAEGLALEHGRQFLHAEEPEEFASAIESLLSDPRRSRELAEAGRRHVLDRHGRARATQAFLELLDVAGRSQPSDRGLAPSISARMRYGDDVADLVEWVEAVVPATARVAVVSKGDPRLIDFDVAQRWHFPCTPDGTYLGHHPADGAAAIALLDRLRLEGLTHLVVPAAFEWWKEHYPTFFEHLDTIATPTCGDGGRGAMYVLEDLQHPQLP